MLMFILDPLSGFFYSIPDTGPNQTTIHQLLKKFPQILQNLQIFNILASTVPGSEKDLNQLTEKVVSVFTKKFLPSSSLDLESRKKLIPNPGSRDKKDPVRGSGSATVVIVTFYLCMVMHFTGFR